MLEKNYKKNKRHIKVYLKDRGCFCFRQNIINFCVGIGISKTAASLTLREMRKRKEIKKAFRRWGL